LFAIGNNHLGYAGGLPHNSYGAISGNIGTLMSFGSWRALLEVEPQLASQKLFNQISYKGELNYIISTNWAVALSGEFIDKKGKNIQEYSFGVRYYF